MLKELRIRNLVLIESLELELEGGLTVLTGETGAGKSVFLAALRLLGGEKGRKEQVRLGADEAKVEGVFSLEGADRAKAVLEREEIDDLGGELVVERTLSASGKSRARVNGTVVPLSVLQEIGQSLLQLHGQSDQLLLKDRATHAELLDLYGHDRAQLENWKSALAKCRGVRARLDALRKRQEELSAQEDWLRFQSSELEKAALSDPGEEEELVAKLAGASERDGVRQAAESALEILRRGENGLSGELRQLERQLERLSSQPALKNAAGSVADARILVQELESSLERLESGSEELSEEEIDRLNARLALLQRLQRKHRTDLAGLIALRDRLKSELASLGNFETDLADLRNECADAARELRAAEAELHAARARAAEDLRSRVESELAKLGMGGARFATRFAELPSGTGADPLSEPLRDSVDDPEFYVAVNPGEGERPLRSTLSGGELSRTMLALKTVLADVDTTPLLVFDEVDAGISGETGNRIGEALAALSAGRQVVTVTHLHQVAARAGTHLLATKSVEGDRTRTAIRALDEEGRVSELARMLGAPENPEALSHARALRAESASRRAG
ncbi:MAG: DNA repair protein RecN [Fibrobacterales bacterium]|nr:DNA repair protein RecN [Fibrobacterales bacterium]